jgi:short-subunit dehydrogenase
MDLKDKVIVVTGASKGLGNTLVKSLAKEGARVILIARSEETLKDIVKNLGKEKHKYYTCDLSDINKVFELADKIKKDFEKIDVLVNGAGIGVYKSIEEVKTEEWENSFDLGVKAPYFLAQQLLPLLQKSDLSLVLNIGSGMGVIPAGGRSVYCSMKFALRGATLSLAEEFKRTKTHFCLITLGSIMTGFGPMNIEEKKREMEEGKAYLTPEWVAKKLIEIIKDEKRDIEYTFFPSEYKGEWSSS